MQPGEQLVRVVLPISAVVVDGDASRVEELSIEVDATRAGLTVHDYAPRNRLETEYAGPIEVEQSGDEGRQVDVSLGGVLPNPSGGVAQLLPSAAIGKSEHDSHRQKASKLAPKEAVVVAGAVAQRRGVLWKFRPSSQTTIEGEHRLEITFIAPEDWPRPGSQAGLTVACAATGKRRVLFVTQRTTWSEQTSPVALLSPTTVQHAARKPTAPADKHDELIAHGPVSYRPAPKPASLWKARAKTNE